MADNVLSQPAVSPCADTDELASVGPLDAPADVPKRILGVRLCTVLKMASGLAADLPQWIWVEPPPPIQACQELEYLGDWLRRLSIAADDARNHVELLWEMSATQASERRAAAAGLDPSGSSRTSAGPSRASA